MASVPSATQTCVVQVNGQTYTNFETCEVVRETNDPANTFSLEFSAGSNLPGLGGLTIYTGDQVQIYFDGMLGFTGNVGLKRITYDSTQHKCTVSGLSQAGNLTNQSVQVKQGSYSGSSLSQTAQSILQGTGINFSVQNDTSGAADKPFQWNNLHIGESIAEIIGRLAKARNLMLSSDENGTLIAHGIVAEAAGASFVEGENILAASILEDTEQGSTAYLATSQTPGTNTNPGRDNAAQANVSGFTGSNALDHFISEMPLASGDLVPRVAMEQQISSWTNFDLEVVVYGFTDDSGQLWKPTGNSCSIYSPMLFPLAPYSMSGLFIQKVIYRADAHSGCTTTITLKKNVTIPVLTQGGSDPSENADAATTPQPAQPDTSGTSSGGTTQNQQQSQEDQARAQAQKQASSQQHPKDATDNSAFDPQPKSRRGIFDLMRTNGRDTARRGLLANARATILEVNDTGGLQTIKVRGLHDEILMDVERHQTYGHTSVPMPPDSDGIKSAEATLSFIGNSRSHPTVNSVDDRRFRPMNLKPGDSCHWHANGANATFSSSGYMVNTGPKKLPMSMTAGNGSIYVSDSKSALQQGKSSVKVEGTKITAQNGQASVVLDGAKATVTVGSTTFVLDASSATVTAGGTSVYVAAGLIGLGGKGASQPVLLVGNIPSTLVKATM